MNVLLIISSLLYTGIGYAIMVKDYYFNFTALQFAIFSAFTPLIYLTAQGIPVLYRKSGDQKGFYIDLMFSFLPVLPVYHSYVRVNDLVEYLHYYRQVYLGTTLFDLIIFTAIAYRMAILTNTYYKD